MKDRLKNKLNYKKVLFFFAHPDDETLSAGGTINKMCLNNIEVKIVIASQGLLSRDSQNIKNIDMHISDLREACEVLGVKKKNLIIGNFKDNSFDNEPLLKLTKYFNKLLFDFKPDAVFTHHKYCTNIDHKYCFEAALICTRPVNGTMIDLYSCETISSTTFNRPYNFDPSYFSVLSKENLIAKKDALDKFRFEKNKFPHMRSKKFIEINAQFRGAQIGTDYAEAFSVINLFN